MARDPGTVTAFENDGGGIRGLISARFMERLAQDYGLDPHNLGATFDVMTGTSIGGIITAGYASGKSPTDLKAFFIEDGPWIFSTSTTVPSVRATTLDKVATLLLGGSFYANTNLVNKLEEEFGELQITEITNRLLMPSYESDTKSLVYFSNMNFPGTKTGLVKDAALATASAPLYFPPAEFNEHIYLDGGVFQNNTATLALALARSSIIKPDPQRVCLLSVGTGRGKTGFHDTPPIAALLKGASSQPCKSLFLSPSKEAEIRSIPPTSEKYKAAQEILKIHDSLSISDPIFPNVALIFELIGLGIGGPQEANAKELDLQAGPLGSTLDQFYYYRFQYDLPDDIDIELDNTTSEFMEYMVDSCDEHYDADEANISAFMQHLAA